MLLGRPSLIKKYHTAYDYRWRVRCLFFLASSCLGGGSDEPGWITRACRRIRKLMVHPWPKCAFCLRFLPVRGAQWKGHGWTRMDTDQRRITPINRVLPDGT